jgi:superoxide reductase
MANRLEVYKCNICGNIVEVLNGNEGSLTCCNVSMNLLTENTVDASKEKHIPVLECTEEGIRVMVGSVEHPMLKEHYIEWIEVISDNKVYREDLQPAQKPQGVFVIKGENIYARAYCNLHGLWKGE